MCAQLSHDPYNMGKDTFSKGYFTGSEWSAPIMTSPQEIRERLDSFHLCGRKIKRLKMIGLSYFHIQDCIEDAAYQQLKGLPEEERQRRSRYANISGDILFWREATIDEPLLVGFEDDDRFEIDTPQEPEFCMSMNCIPWDIASQGRASNMAADVLFAPCIGQTVTEVEVHTYLATKHPMYGTPLEPAQEMVSSIILWLGNGVGLRVGGWIDYCAVDCIDRGKHVLQIRCDELKSALLDEDTLADDNKSPVPDSPMDLPSTVTPFTPHDRQVQELRRVFSKQPLKEPEQEDQSLYIWRKADEFVKSWLPQEGYTVLKSEIFEDSIGYSCTREGEAYTVFLYAYGQKRTAHLDGDFCARLRLLPFAAQSTILILYLHVDRQFVGEDPTYKVQHYSGKDDCKPELWRLTEINGKPILQYYPCKEMLDRIEHFIYAFNREDTDVYDCIIVDEDAKVDGCITEHDGCSTGTDFYSALLRAHRKYGDMKLGYILSNDVIYSAVPYIDGLCFFNMQIDSGTYRIRSVSAYPFTSGAYEVREFLKPEQRVDGRFFEGIPMLVGAEPLPPTETERFALLAFFDNGMCRKYVLPVEEAEENQEAVPYLHYVFTDEIWASAKVLFRHASRYDGYPACGPAVIFKNGSYIAGIRCCLESEPYSEPLLTNEGIYEDQTLRVKRIWSWDVSAIYQDAETGLLRVLLSGQAFNRRGKSTLASVEGRRLTSLAFDDLGKFQDGRARFFCQNKGYGYIDPDMKLTIPKGCTWAGDFEKGMAEARKNGAPCFFFPDGSELLLQSPDPDRPYQDVGAFCEGLCRVSTLRLEFMDLAFHSDHSTVAGVWGFVDKTGREVIAPQYIYAYDFHNGIALVAKGKWTIDPKWDNEYNEGLYWTEEELWGGIDPSGKEVIPCIFDEISHFGDEPNVFRAHFGGWETGKWGIIDRNGKWLAEPTFAKIDDEFSDGLFAFCMENGEDDVLEDGPWGVFDLKRGTALLEPQFSDVSFPDRESICVEVFDKALGRRVRKILDRTGRERFKSIYTGIYTWQDPYEVYIYEGGEDRHGLINKDGSVVLPCVYHTAWGGIDHKRKRIIFVQDGKQGMMDFDGNVMIPAKYYEIRGLSHLLLTVRVGDKEQCAEGLITQEGREVLPPRYERISWCGDKRHFFCYGGGLCEMYQVEIKQAIS